MFFQFFNLEVVRFKMSYIVWGIGSLIISTLVYYMGKEYYNNLSINDDIEIYGNDRTRIRHEEGI